MSNKSNGKHHNRGHHNRNDKHDAGLLVHHLTQTRGAEKDKVLDFMLADLAVQRALRFPLPMEHGSSVYTLSRQDWCGRVLRDIDDIHQVRDEEELRHAMRAVGVRYVLIAHDSRIDHVTLNKVCRDSGQIKTIFWEQ